VKAIAEVEGQTVSTATWLHISDLHWRESEAYEANVVAQALLRDLANRIEIAPCLEHIDFIFMTGDIAFASKPEEYVLAQRFLDNLRRTTRVRKDHTFVVPGNHDVDRDIIYDKACDIVSRCSEPVAVNELLGDEVHRAVIMQRFHRYQKFVRLYFGEDLPFDSVRYFYIKRRKITGNRWAAILGLNSVWASASDADRLNLLLGERQVRAALDQAKRADVRIALMHHPFDWLQDSDHEACEPLLLGNCDFVLHGHLHRADLRRLQAPGSEAMVIGAGACYDTREHPNAYNLVHLDFDKGEGTVYLRMYSDRGGGFWTQDVLTYQNAPGEYTFDLPRTGMIEVLRPTQRRLSADVTAQAAVSDESAARSMPEPLPSYREAMAVVPEEDRPSIRRQLTEARENLRLIKERQAEFVLSTDIPLQLFKEERRLLDRIAELEQQLAEPTVPGGPGPRRDDMGSTPEQLRAGYERVGLDKWWKERGYNANPFEWSNAEDVEEEDIPKLFHLWHVDPRAKTDLGGLGPTPTLDKVKSPGTSRLVLIFTPGGGGKTFYCRWATRQVREGEQHALEIHDIDQRIQRMQIPVRKATPRDLAACIYDCVCERFSIPKALSLHDDVRHILRKCDDVLEFHLSVPQGPTRVYVFIDDIDRLFDEQPSEASRNARAFTAIVELCRAAAERHGGERLALRIFIPQQLRASFRNRLRGPIRRRHIDEYVISWTPAHCEAVAERRLDSRWKDGPNTGINHISRLLTQDARDEFHEWLQHQEGLSPGRVVEVLHRLAHCAYGRGVAADGRIGVEFWKEFSRSSECTDICTPDALYPGVRMA